MSKKQKHFNDKYGFGKIKVGKKITIEVEDLTSARVAAYTYAKRNGLKFSCSKNKQGNLVVNRIA